MTPSSRRAFHLLAALLACSAHSIVPDHRVPLDEAAFDAAFGQGRDGVLEAALRLLDAPGG